MVESAHEIFAHPGALWIAMVIMAGLIMQGLGFVLVGAAFLDTITPK